MTARLLALALLFLLSARAAEAQITSGPGSFAAPTAARLFGATLTNVSAATTSYLGPAGNQPNANQATWQFDGAATVTNFLCSSAQAPGAGQTYTIKIFKDGTDAGAPAGTIAGAAAFSTGNVPINVLIASGDTVQLQLVTSATAVASTFACIIRASLSS